jgi:hypothetical protein
MTQQEAIMQQSEVARLLAQVSAEYEAAQWGLTGFASGAARHTFITARMEQMSRLHTQLRAVVGDDAMRLLTEQLDRLPENSEPLSPSVTEEVSRFSRGEGAPGCY